MRSWRTIQVNSTKWRRTLSIEQGDSVSGDSPLCQFFARRQDFSGKIDPLAYRALRIRRERKLAR
jgi:hypothetical protein